jgi:dTDP-4-amino-4,6-dideoxygalactose transaminase
VSAWIVPVADVRFTEREVAAVADVYRSGWVSMGSHVRGFEEAFSERVGGEHCVAVSSGTAALHAAALAAGLGPGTEFVAPSLSFVATVSALAQTGAEPVLVDVASPTAPWPTAEAYGAATGPRTRAIVSMPYGGHPGVVRELRELADARGLVLIEDAAHGVAGQAAPEVPVGSLGDVAAFSFFSNKNLPIGEGGMVATRHPEWAAELRLLRSHGMTTSSWDRHAGRAAEYTVVRAGYNYRLDEPRARLATLRLAALDGHQRARAAHADFYRAAITKLPSLRATDGPPAGTVSANHLFTVVVDGDVDRDGVRTAMAARGIQTSVHYPPIHQFGPFGGANLSLPVTEEYARRTITLPLFPHLTAEQRELVVAELDRAVTAYRPKLWSVGR